MVLRYPGTNVNVAMQAIADMTTTEVRHCAVIKFFPQLMHAFTAMHVEFTDGRAAQSTTELRAALAEALPLGRGDSFFSLVSKISSAKPSAPLFLSSGLRPVFPVLSYPENRSRKLIQSA